jgi:hypothetical protein
MIGSTYVLNALALAKVVKIRLCSIKEQAILLINALRCEAVLPKLFILSPCLIVFFSFESLKV